MRPPIVVSRLGTLDVFDDLDEVQQRYPLDVLAGSDVMVWDSEGRPLRVHRQSGGTFHVEPDIARALDAADLAQVLREHLERGGMSCERCLSMELSELIDTVYPPPCGGRSFWESVATWSAAGQRVGRLRFGWVILGTVCGALVGLMDMPSNLAAEFREYWTALCEFRGAVAGTAVGAVLSAWFRRGESMRQWHRSVLAETAIVVAVLVPLWQYRRATKFFVDSELRRDFSVLQAKLDDSTLSPAEKERVKRQMSQLEGRLLGVNDLEDSPQ
ncbi:MAG: hypothetical protein ACYC35_18170 [Pirellulales bacterium]